MKAEEEKNNILEVAHLGVTLRGDEILKDISFFVKRGEALAIIGPNGAGKTVLLQALMDLLPYKGSIHWAPSIRTGYVPQKFFIDRYVPFTVQEFFLLKSSQFWLSQKKFIEHLRHELDLVGLPTTILQNFISNLSGGQLRRVLISWAMLDHPDVLLLDEPTEGIDIGAEETIYNLVNQVQKERGTTILLVSHDLNIVYRHAQDVLCINKQLICHGAPREVLHPQELLRLYGEGGFYHHLK